MKTLLLISFYFLFNFQQDDTKLNGKYKVTSEQRLEEYVIIFNDSVYKKVYKSGEEINGVVKYGNLISLIDYESSPKVVGQKTIERLKEKELITIRNIGKDKFSYCFCKYRKGGPINWLDICESSGEMVKVK